MLRPAVNQIISKNESCYSLVIAVAKRAREITTEIYKSGQILGKNRSKQPLRK